ncbi:lysine-specific demethylase 3A isoform X2 [Neocloeon triangulifer]|uniref:lysine-specific demethylase 3A isoform X2 n=1 Tax=Neocloeon triangulifer TaxID=2078957 RepID=UPI00286ED8FF|nr:lysine-specific demethylase 3A isoform X2 [Neocloeon triangulifer]
MNVPSAAAAETAVLFKFREELVGKRFLSLSGGSGRLKTSRIGDWGWRAGVIRAASHRDTTNPELQVLVEYDDVEWQRREWFSPHKGHIFHVFLIENRLVWAPRGENALHPALTFKIVVDNAQVAQSPVEPIEFLTDRAVSFRDVTDYEPFQGWEKAPQEAARDAGDVISAIKQWTDFQNGQSILLSTPSVLVGYRVEVYRAEGTTQWYTAVIVAYNEASSDLTVTDDTVLEEHNEDPRLVQMRLIGDGVVESIMRGDNQGITSRRSRSATAASSLSLQSPMRTQRVTSTPSSSPGGRSNHTPPSFVSSASTNSNAIAARKAPRGTDTPDKDQASGAAPNCARIRRRKASGASLSASGGGSSGSPSLAADGCWDNKRQPQQQTSSDSAVVSKVVLEEKAKCPALSDEEVVEVGRVKSVHATRGDGNKLRLLGPTGDHDSARPTTMLHQQQSAPQQPGDLNQRIIDASSPLISNSLSILPSSAASDSGVSSLRSSSSSDERSASASSSSRSSETGSSGGAAASSSSAQNLGAPPTTEPVRVWRDPSLVQASEPLVRHIHSVQHISLMPHHPPPAPPASAPPAGSVESRIGAPPSAQSAPPGRNPSPVTHYPPLPPPMLSPHPGLPHPHLITSPMYAQELWKQRYLAAAANSAGAHPDDILERERALAQDRERQERYIRERQGKDAALMAAAYEQNRDRAVMERARVEHEIRERREMDRVREERYLIEKERMAREANERERRAQEQERERERQRQAMEKKRQEQAVHKHFEESLRLAQNKRSGGNWSQLTTLPPPPMSRAAQEEEARKQANAAQQQRLILAERQRQEARQQAYYGSAPPSTQPSAVSAISLRKEYPQPPAAHSRTMPPSKHPHLPEPKAMKMEPGFNSLGYPAYQPAGLLTTVEKKPKSELPNPPPLLSEPKSSVIVKNEAKREPSPMVGAPKYSSYPVRTATPQKVPHHLPQAEPRAMLYQTGPPFATAGKGSAVAYPYTTGPPPPANPKLYGQPPSTAPAALCKPKVSSPAPQHIYGLPTQVLGPPSVSSHHHQTAEVPSPLPLNASQPHHLANKSYLAPPPAHSRRHLDHVRAMDHIRVFPPGTPSPSPGATPAPRASPLPVLPSQRTAAPPVCQMQPLDLGCKDPSSPNKRSAPSPDPSKKRRVETPQPPPVQPSPTPPPMAASPQLSRVSEPSPLIASAATTITTIENKAVAASAAGGAGVIQRPPSVPQPSPSTTPNKAPSPAPTKSIHGLKKAWLHRHTTGEDVVGEPRCVTPVTPAAPSPVPCSSPVATTQVPASPPQPSTPKGKAKVPFRKATASVNPSMLNGHGPESGQEEESTSSDEPATQAKRSPAKRKPGGKRRRGGKKTAVQEEKNKRRSVVGAAATAASDSDSDKESGTEKDSEDSASSNKRGGGKEASGGSNGGGSSNNSGGNSGAKKRGRRPKSKNDEPRPPKKARGAGGNDDGSPTPPPRDPTKKPPISQLKKTGESFLQDGHCFEVAPKLAKCRECRLTQNQRNKEVYNNIFCRFYYFRRLRYTKNGQLAIAGFSDPHLDAKEEDVKLWTPDATPTDIDPGMAKFLLTEVGDQFCDIVQQELEAKEISMAKDKKIVWKKVVQKVREMCDVCETTLFNFHWACDKCGFVVCIDCYKNRKNGKCKRWEDANTKDRDDFLWLLCTNKQGHELERLMLTQIIVKDALTALGRKMHDIRSQYGIKARCACPLNKEVVKANGICKEVQSKADLNGTEKSTNGGSEPTSPKTNVNGEKEAENSPLSVLADVALSSDKKEDSVQEAKSPEKESLPTLSGWDSSDSDSDGDKDEANFSTLRELLIRRPCSKSQSGSESPTGAQQEEKSDDQAEDDKDEKESPKQRRELKNFKRSKEYRVTNNRLPWRVMTLTKSKLLYPNVPHQWQCDGRLLVLTDASHRDNKKIFQDQWKRGQPVIVLNVAAKLNQQLWHPDKFAQDFGDQKADLINCMSGNVVPNIAIRHFWEGFEQYSKRLKDKQGNSMILKLKDWPPGEDFADMLPAHMQDLMEALPLSDYTHRNGKLNIASRLPEYFVKPDLGPKMYNAYGSSLFPDKGTTNLHLDISDAVNVMVYSGCCKDLDNEDNMKAALKAIDEAGCDVLTRRRVREKGVIPGALWHIYDAADADSIRDLLNLLEIENGKVPDPSHDPIHNQSWYLDEVLRERLYLEYNVTGYAIVQCLGDAVFVPAGAPHQVRNLHNCIKVAEDFVSPENVSHCFQLTQQFRELSDTHTNHEDKLQIKNIIYHAVKDSVAVLTTQLMNNPEAVNEPESAEDDKSSVKKVTEKNEKSESGSDNNAGTVSDDQSEKGKEEPASSCTPPAAPAADEVKKESNSGSNSSS